MDRTEILEGIKSILRGVNTVDQDMVDTLDEKTDFLTDLGAPSTELINIVAKAEDHFGVEFDDDAIDSMGTSVGDTIDLIVKAQGS